VVGAAADLARDSERGAFAADPLRRLRMQDAVGAVHALGVLGRFGANFTRSDHTTTPASDAARGAALKSDRLIGSWC